MLLKRGEKFNNLLEILELLRSLEIKIDEWYKEDYFENRENLK